MWSVTCGEGRINGGNGPPRKTPGGLRHGARWCQSLLRGQFRGLKCGLRRQRQAAPLTFEKIQFGKAIFTGGVKAHGLTASRAQRKSIGAN